MIEFVLFIVLALLGVGAWFVALLFKPGDDGRIGWRIGSAVLAGSEAQCLSITQQAVETGKTGLLPAGWNCTGTAAAVTIPAK